MKKCLITLTVALVSVMAVMAQPAPKTYADDWAVQINKYNFEDPYFREYLKTSADLDQDGFISSSEIKNVKQFSFLNQKFVSLKGIEYFFYLESLELRYCELPSLDLSSNTRLKKLVCDNGTLQTLTLGQHRALTELNCFNNQLTALDVTGCPSLTLLNCGMNKIQSLNLSKCTALTELHCFQNDLSILDVSACTALTILSCELNNLTTLDLRSNTALTQLHCGSNQLESLDLRQNTALTQLTCGWNQLKTLNVSKNSQMTSLICNKNKLAEIDVSKMKSLKMLYCYNNSLATLDVSNCKELEILYCEENLLTELDVTNNTALKELNFAYNGLTSIDLSKNTVLEKLNCSWNRLTSLDLSKNTNLAKASCWENNLTVIDIHLCPILVNVVKNNERKTGSNLGEEYYFHSAASGEFIDFDKNVKLITYIPSVGKVTGLAAASAGKNKVKLTWNAVDGAEGYLVYAQKDGKYGYVGMTTQGTTFTDTKALDSDYNYYWVFAYAKDDGGFMHAGACEKYVYAKGVTLAVTNLKASSVTGGVKLSWTASSGADGYLVYGIRPGGSYGYIGMTTKGTTYTDTKASKTDYTFYWVFPYHKASDGSMIVGGTAKYTYGRAK